LIRIVESHLGSCSALTHLVLTLNALSDHFVDPFYCHSSHRAQPPDDLLVFKQENLAKNQLIRAQAHFFNLGDIGDDLLDDMAVV